MKALLGPFPGGASADALNRSIPYLQIFVDASKISPGLAPAPIFQSIQINAQQQVFDFLEFPAGEIRDSFFTLGHRSLPFFNYTDPELRAYPEWMQIADATAPNPAEYVCWDIAFGIAKNGETYDYTIGPTPAGQQVESLVLDAWVHAGAGESANEAISLPVADAFGSTFDANDFNSLQFEVQRRGSAAGDTYGESAYLRGVWLQYKTDFNNKSQWPVA